MRRGRLLILIGLILLLGTVAVFLFARPLLNVQLGGGNPGPTVGATPLPVEVTPIVIAIQDIPRGAVIPEAAVQLAPWPTSYLPEGPLFDVSEAAGRTAFVELRRGNPVLLSQTVDSPLQQSDSGSYASVIIPPGQVAFSLPLNRLSGVSLLMRPGDHLDVLISLLFVDLDQEFQSMLPNYAYQVQPPIPETVDNPVSGEAGLVMGVYGPEAALCRRYDASGFSFPFCEAPREAQRSRLVTQMIVSDAVVLHVGDSPLEKPETVEATPTPAPSAAEEAAGPEGEGAVVEPPKLDLITLIVSPQDALVLNYALKSGADIAFALRAAGDTARIETESVTLQYLIEHFNIPVPAKLPYGTQPRVDQIAGPTPVPEQ